MTRVVGGVARGQRLSVPDQARPTSDRAREALFSMLESLRGGWAGTRVLDLFAGSGALGLEALSRGAASAVLVESDRAAVATIRANAGSVLRPGVEGAVEVQQRAVHRWLQQPPGALERPFDVVFCDPPYATADAEVRTVVADLAGTGRLAVNALVVLERSARDARWQWPDGFDALRDRRYGEAHLWIARW